jgi:hypothetical protein
MATATTTTPIDRSEVFDLCDSNDEPTGFVIEGHVDLEQFRAACLERQRTDWGLDESEVETELTVEHDHWTTMPRPGFDGGGFVAVPEDWLGATAVTVAYIDQSSGQRWTHEQELDRQLSAVRELDEANAKALAAAHRTETFEALLREVLPYLPPANVLGARVRSALEATEAAR